MRKSIKKILSLIIIGTTLSILPIIGASAEWKQDSKGLWWYSTGTSWATGWSQIDGKWYYFDNSGYMKTGWVQDGASWYYLQQDGSMATNITTPDGYTVDSNGVWITTSNSTTTSATTTLPSTVTDTNTVNTPTTSTSNSSSTNSSSSSSVSKNDYITIHYDKDYKMLDVMGGKQTNVETDGVKYDYIIINASDYNMSKSEFITKAWSTYELKNENGTVKLVPKSTSSNSGSSNNDSNNSNDSNDSEVITTPPETTTGSAVIVTTSSAVSFAV